LQKSPTPLRRHLWLALRLVFLIAILAFIVSRIDVRAFLAQAQQLNWGYVALGFGFILLDVGMAALRWKVVMDVVAPGVSFFSLLAFSLVGIFYSQFLPGSVTGDLVKGYYLARTDADKVGIFSSVVVDRLVGIIMNGLIGLAALSSNPVILSAIHMNPNVPLILIAVTVTGLALGYALFALLGRWENRFPRLIASIYNALKLYRQHPLALAKAALVNLGFFGTWAVGFWFLARAAGLAQLDFPTALVILAAVSFVQTIPISINGWGVREGTLILLLSAYNVPSEQALLLSLLAAAANLLLAVLGGIVVLADYRYIREQTAERG
jgi:uncharacterized protein (TIRG00374 family)